MDQNSSAPRPPNLSKRTDGVVPPNDPQILTDQVTRSTHHIHDVKLHKGAVQFLLSTQKDHLWDSRRVEVEEGGAQCDGIMSDSSIQSLAAAFGRQGESSSPQPNVGPKAASFSGPGRTLTE